MPESGFEKRLLLHICCAPDATVPVKELKAEGWNLEGFFYGSNIHPQEEYARRLDALSVLRAHEPFILEEGRYDPDSWFAGVAGLLNEPEGGARCTACFELQLRVAAEKAVERGCSHLCTTLTISPHKDVARIAQLGQAVCLSFGLKWEDRVWRKQNGFLRSLELSREFGLYRQNYCGCECSLRSAQRREV